MKRNLYCIFIVLFILSACQPRPGRRGQAATSSSTRSKTPTVTIEPKPNIEPQMEKLTHDILKDTEMLIGENSLEEVSLNKGEQKLEGIAGISLMQEKTSKINFDYN